VPGQFRNGLLLMLLAAGVHYFAGGYGPFTLPGDAGPLVAMLTPVLFVLGLSVALWSLFQRMRA
jgi:hypothetical protein